jgi:hypothetical protein
MFWNLEFVAAWCQHNSQDNFTLHSFINSIESNICNRGYFFQHVVSIIQSTQSSFLDNLINWIYMCAIIRPNFANLLEDPNSLHEQFYTSLLWFQLN